MREPLAEADAAQQLLGARRASAIGIRAMRIGISAFSSALNSGSRWWNWNTKPTCRFRNATRSASGIAVSSASPIATAPLIGAIEPAEHVQQRALPHA